MIIDSLLEFADAVALNTGGVAEYLLGSQVDLTNIGRQPGEGQPLYLVITVDTAFASATGKVRFKLASDASAAIATDGTATEHWVSHDFLAADMPAGKVIIVPLPAGDAPPYERFLGILQETITAAFTAGKINAFLTHEVGKFKAYADAQN